MDQGSQLYESLRCRKCERRLNKPMELGCGHIICRDCLETILRNHRSNARCPVCDQALGKYQMENYSYLSPKHPIVRLLSTFTDVNQCETCKMFTTVEACPQCSKDQCESCLDEHEKTHRVSENPSKDYSDDFTNEEKLILESMRTSLTANEYEHFVHTARAYLNHAIAKSDGSSASGRTGESMSDSKANVDLNESVIYDWSKHEKLNANDILTSKPERVQRLLRLNFTPRPYQIRMIRAGLKGENSLVCLQTGAGKTFVAGMVAKFFHILSLQKLADSSANASNTARRFKAVFLVPIRALVDQQCAAFRKVFIDEPDSILKPIDNQAGERFKDLYQRFDIFFFTVQRFVNFVEAEHTNLSHFDLIMVDECHHCYDNHPINSMMRQYHRLKKSGGHVPQIIALTASVGTNKKNAFSHLVHLCANLDCFDICAVRKGAEEDELRSSTNTPLADTIITVPKEENDPVVRILKDNIMIAIASRVGRDISTMDNQKLDNFLVLEHNTACQTNDRDGIIGFDYLRKLNRFLLFYEDLPLEQCMGRLEDVLEGMKPSSPIPFDTFCQKKLDEFRTCVAQQISRHVPVTAKLQKLVNLIDTLHRPGSRGLILVRTKFHTLALKEFLDQHPRMIERKISVGRLTGQGPAEDLCLPGTQQTTVLNEFRKGTKSVLVATDVAQEGLDVAECSYVIRYEFVSNEIGTVQSRGRARAAQSQCYLLTETQSLNNQREMENRQRENEMKAAIDEWHRRGTEEFRDLVAKEQSELFKDLPKTDAPEPTTQSSRTNRFTAKAIHCRFCDLYLCRGSQLRLQGNTVVCTDPAFKRLLSAPEQAGAKFVCPNTACQRELGVVILLIRNVPAYALQITSLKFYMNDANEPYLFKKWSLYQGYVEPL